MSLQQNFGIFLKKRKIYHTKYQENQDFKEFLFQKNMLQQGL